METDFAELEILARESPDELAMSLVLPRAPADPRRPREASGHLESGLWRFQYRYRAKYPCTECACRHRKRYPCFTQTQDFYLRPPTNYMLE